MVLNFDQIHIILSPYSFLKTAGFHKQGDIILIVIHILTKWSQTGLLVSALETPLVVIFKIRQMKCFVGSVTYPIPCMF